MGWGLGRRGGRPDKDHFADHRRPEAREIGDFNRLHIHRRPELALGAGPRCGRTVSSAAAGPSPKSVGELRFRWKSRAPARHDGRHARTHGPLETWKLAASSCKSIGRLLSIRSTIIRSFDSIDPHCSGPFFFDRSGDQNQIDQRSNQSIHRNAQINTGAGRRPPAAPAPRTPPEF